MTTESGRSKSDDSLVYLIYMKKPEERFTKSSEGGHGHKPALGVCWHKNIHSARKSKNQKLYDKGADTRQTR